MIQLHCQQITARQQLLLTSPRPQSSIPIRIYGYSPYSKIHGHKKYSSCWMRKSISLIALIYHLLSVTLLLHNSFENALVQMDLPAKKRRRRRGAKVSGVCKGTKQKHRSHHQPPPQVVGNNIPVNHPRLLGTMMVIIEFNCPADIRGSFGPSLLIRLKHIQQKMKARKQPNIISKTKGYKKRRHDQ